MLIHSVTVVSWNVVLSRRILGSRKKEILNLPQLQERKKLTKRLERIKRWTERRDTLEIYP